MEDPHADSRTERDALANIDRSRNRSLMRQRSLEKEKAKERKETADHRAHRPGHHPLRLPQNPPITLKLQAEAEREERKAIAEKEETTGDPTPEAQMDRKAPKEKLEKEKINMNPEHITSRMARKNHMLARNS